MKKQIKCIHYGCQKRYCVRREKKRCSSCGYEWNSGKLPLHLTRKKWSNILHWFLRGLPVVAIAQETRAHRQHILRALTYVRNSFQKGEITIISG